MDIIIGKTMAMGKEPQFKSPPSVRRKNGPLRDRRKNKQDRRKSRRDGIWLSLQNDQRVLRDRRRTYI